MGKHDMSRARSAATDYSTNVANRTSADVTGLQFGDNVSSFGPRGLTGTRNDLMGTQGDLISTAGNNYKTNAITGGFDPTAKGTIESGYTDMANNGGFTPEDEANFRRRATSGVASVYNTLSNQAQRDKALTGGLGPGGEIAQMARHLAQDQATAATNAEVELNQQKNANKFQGLGGLTQEQGAVAAGRNAANTGISHLVDTTTGEITSLGNQILQEYGLSDASQQQKVALLSEFGLKGPSALSQVTGGVGNILGAVTGVGKLASSIPQLFTSSPQG